MGIFKCRFNISKLLGTGIICRTKIKRIVLSFAYFEIIERNVFTIIIDYFLDDPIAIMYRDRDTKFFFKFFLKAEAVF